MPHAHAALASQLEATVAAAFAPGGGGGAPAVDPQAPPRLIRACSAPSNLVSYRGTFSGHSPCRGAARPAGDTRRRRSTAPLSRTLTRGYMLRCAGSGRRAVPGRCNGVSLNVLQTTSTSERVETQAGSGSARELRFVAEPATPDGWVAAARRLRDEGHAAIAAARWRAGADAGSRVAAELGSSFARLDRRFTSGCSRATRSPPRRPSRSCCSATTPRRRAPPCSTISTRTAPSSPR